MCSLHIKELKERKGLKLDSVKGTVMLTKEYDDLDPIVNVTSIVINRDAFINHTIQAWGDISIGEGVVIIGSIHSNRTVTIWRGMGEYNQPTTIIGDIYAKEIIIKDFRESENSKEPVVIFGNVYGEKLEFSTNVFVRGNIYCKSYFKNSKMSFVSGTTKMGSPENPCEGDLENFGSYTLYCFGSLKIGKNVSVLEPIITINGTSITNAKLDWESKYIRVISAPCLKCSRTSDLLMCPLMESCYEYSILAHEDVFQSRNNMYISWYWRCLPETILRLPETILHHYVIDQMYQVSLRRLTQIEINYLLNNKKEFKNAYRRYILDKLLAIDTSILTIMKWFERKGLNPEVLSQMNLAGGVKMEHVIKSPEIKDLEAVSAEEPREFELADEFGFNLPYEDLSAEDIIYFGPAQSNLSIIEEIELYKTSMELKESEDLSLEEINEPESIPDIDYESSTDLDNSQTDLEKSTETKSSTEFDKPQPESVKTAKQSTIVHSPIKLNAEPSNEEDADDEEVEVQIDFEESDY